MTFPPGGAVVLTGYPNLSNVLLVREKHERGTGFKKLSDKTLDRALPRG